MDTGPDTVPMTPVTTSRPAATAAPPPPPRPPVALPVRLTLRFVGSGSEYFRIWITNLVLILITFGLYYPFAKARRLRYFYGCAEVGGHAMAFHGNPWSMFRGYLLVGVLFFVYSLAQKVSPLIGAAALFALGVLVWPALWRASLRFRLANTSWRGLRASFVGQRRGAYLAFLVPALGMVAVAFAVVVVAMVLLPSRGPGPADSLLGLLPLLLMLGMLPWLVWRLRRYQHNHYRFGAEQTGMSVPLNRVYAVFLRASAFGVLVPIVIVTGALMLGAAARLPDGGPKAAPTVAFGGLAAVFAGFLLMQVLVRTYFAARLQNLFWNATRSEHLQFESRLGFGSLAGLTLKNWLLMIVTLGLYYPFAAVATARLRVEAMTMVSAVDPDMLFSRESAAQAAAVGDAAVDALGFDIGL